MDRRLKGFIILTFTVLLFSTFEVTCKLIGPKLHPFQISFFRFLIGGLVLFPFSMIRIRKLKLNLTKKFFLNMLILGFVNIVVSMGLIQFGLLYTKASVAAVIFSSNPIFVAFFAGLILKEKISKEKLAGMFIGIVGVILLFGDKLEISSLSGVGPFLVLMAAICFSFYTVLGKRLTMQATDSLVMTSFSFIFGSILLVPVMLFMKIPLLTMDKSILPHIVYLGVFVSGIAYMCYFYGLAKVNTSTGALVYFIKPVLAAVLSVWILKESLSVNFYLGTVIILLGMVIVNYKQFFYFKSGVFFKS